ncbi:MAG: Fic family protein, partial [Myxococcaceae bacterium]
MERYDLKVVTPPVLAAVAERHHPASTSDWLLVPPPVAPEPTLAGELEFALKREGVNLAVLSALFKAVPATELAATVRAKPTGQYSRRIWFLYEWLTSRTLDVPAAGKVRAFDAVDPNLQVALAKGRTSRRHRIIDNLPGTPAFCPMVRRTEALRRYTAARLDERARAVIGRTHPDVVARAAAFLLLSDSQASFNIEGERPAHERALRWARAIGEAGSRPLSREELERLQKIVIGDDRFVPLGLRKAGGFIGMHHRTTREPLPDHISARAEDLLSLVDGIVAYDQRATAGGIDAVIAAAAESFGFVYVHPFSDGNGRLHRWLIHHVLARAAFSPPGLVFPVSAAILRLVNEYRHVLESYSRALLPLIEWRATEDHNVEVL